MLVKHTQMQKGINMSIERSLLKLMKAPLNPNRFNKPSGFNTQQNYGRTASEIADFTPGAADTRVGFDVGAITDKIGRAAEGALTKPMEALGRKKEVPEEVEEVEVDDTPALGSADNPYHYIQDNPSGTESASTDSVPSTDTNTGTTAPKIPEVKTPEVKPPQSLLNTLEKLMKEGGDKEGRQWMRTEHYEPNRPAGIQGWKQRDLLDRTLEEVPYMMDKPVPPRTKKRLSTVSVDEPQNQSSSGRAMDIPMKDSDLPPEMRELIYGTAGDESFSSSAGEYKPSRKPTKRDMQEFSIENSLVKLMKEGAPDKPVEKILPLVAGALGGLGAAAGGALAGAGALGAGALRGAGKVVGAALGGGDDDVENSVEKGGAAIAGKILAPMGAAAGEAVVNTVADRMQGKDKIENSLVKLMKLEKAPDDPQAGMSDYFSRLKADSEKPKRQSLREQLNNPNSRNRRGLARDIAEKLRAANPQGDVEKSLLKLMQ